MNLYLAFNKLPLCRSTKFFQHVAEGLCMRWRELEPSQEIEGLHCCDVAAVVESARYRRKIAQANFNVM
jgi:hypothetical protein